jgi:ATP-dependent DNA helicase RecG
MEINPLKTAVAYLKGVGPQRAALLTSELGIARFEDLLFHFPFRYVDRSKFYKINELRDAESEVQLVGKIVSIADVTGKGKKRLSAIFEDASGQVELVWFQGARFIKNRLQLHTPYVLFGKPNYFSGRYSFPHPELELVSDFKASGAAGLQPVYSSSEKLNNQGLNSRAIWRLVKQVLPQVKDLMEENLPEYILRENRLMSRVDALWQVHIPKNIEWLEHARRRIKFEECLYMQLTFQGVRQYHKAIVRGHVFSKVGDTFNHFYQQHLPFDLTEAQKRVLRDVRRDMGRGYQMNRLIQGDVGSGKTIVALLSMLLAIDNGFQACLMAPTEILARQHYEGISDLLKGTNIRVGLLTGSTRAAARREMEQSRMDGSLHIQIGTHALLEEVVQFRNLGLAIIDEQHRFGVRQRAAMWEKNTLPPHVMVMTATPIPRTLAMTVYGDLDVSVIDELPPGRKPITTYHFREASRLRMLGMVKKEIDAGRQAYIVYPLIEESEKLDYQNLMEGYDGIAHYFPLPKYRISMVHGKLKPEEKEVEMERFASGQTQIMVATTVIEVGVNVPNATVMVIESAERFGLSQLHQLRGRVGRGADQSYCILMTGNKMTTDGRVRMETMVRTQDGFEISEVDMKLRGPGDILGTQQSGLVPFKMTDLLRDSAVIQHAREVAAAIMERDPGLKAPEHQVLLPQYESMLRERARFGRVS